MKNENLPSVAVIVLNWNGKDDTVQTLRSLKGVTYPHFYTILVDNGSTDDSVETVRTGFPEVTLIEIGRNLGFAGGNNVGMRHALSTKTDAVLLLNNDVEVAPDFIDHLVDALYASPDTGAVNPKIYYHSQPDVIWSAGGDIDYRKCQTFQRFIDEKDTGQADQIIPVDFAVGCAMLVKREVIEQVGLMDEDFFVYYEETEWCHRIRKAGHQILYVPQSKIWHKVSRAMADRPGLSLYYFSRNRLIFGQKCGLGALHVLRTAALGLGRVAGGYLVHGNFKHAHIVARAVRDYYFKTYGEARI